MNPCMVFEEHYEGACKSNNHQRCEQESECGAFVGDRDEEDEDEGNSDCGKGAVLAGEVTECILHFWNLSYGAWLP